ncbi:MAG: CBS domain-containing protein [Bacilli bacterium]|nr:CBS domain-containing protein [Bacilli bacterium]
MKIKSIMSRDIITCDIKDSFKDVANLMLKYDIGFIPVKKDQKVIGVVTDRDLVIYGLANENLALEKCLKKVLITVNSNDSIKKCLQIMKKYKVRRLIVKEKNKLVGIVSISDIVNNYKNAKELVSLLKCIFEISCNCDYFEADVGEFKL